MTTVLAGAEWVVRAEYDEACHVACLGCAAESGAVGVAVVWAIEHARRGGPGHDRFLAATRTHWHVVPRRVTWPVWGARRSPGRWASP
ncbi:DUF7848 domain-containing protein, partial [Streptomyces sp. URMC 129]|uniref:DUF7848 domain-containing protein n=1 Tax=Streptomyces sp. URMC 129 TaxID=3423407 RepID=UPI003F1A1B7A